jgi:hypothetical protein
MVGRSLHWVSVVCCGFVVVSFVLFADAKLSSASSHQAGLIAPPKTLATTTPTGALGLTTTPAVAAQAPAKPHQTGQPRAFIDGVASALESPFTSLSTSDDSWFKHIVPMLCALLLYGVGIGFLGRWAAGRS